MHDTLFSWDLGMRSIRFDLALTFLAISACSGSASHVPEAAPLLREPTGPPWESWQPQEKTDQLVTDLGRMEAFDYRIVEDQAFVEETWRAIFALLDTIRAWPGQTPATRRTTDTLMLAYDVVEEAGRIHMDLTYLYGPQTEGMLWRWRMPLDRGAPGQDAQLAIRFDRALSPAGQGFDSVTIQASADTTQTPKWQAKITATALAFGAEGTGEVTTRADHGLELEVLRGALWERAAGEAYLEPGWAGRAVDLSLAPWPVAGLKTLKERPLENVGLQSAFPLNVEDLEGLNFGEDHGGH